MTKLDNPTAGLRLETLDALRLLAALAVVFFHFGFRGQTLGVTDVAFPAYEPVLKYGYLGVQLFFVISGFVIAYSAEGRTPLQFGIARFARIYPTFVLCMTITFVVIVLFGAPYFQATLGQWAANLLIRSQLVGKPALDGSYWSIFYEVVFYAWVFVFMAVGWFKRANYPAIVIGWLLISVIDRATISSGIMRYLLLTDESAFFCAGLLIYAAFRDGYDRKILALLILCTAVAIFQSLQLAQWNRENYGVAYSDLVVAAACIAIFATVAAAIRFPRMPLPSQLMLAIGGLTYPLYLLHQYVGYIVIRHAGPMLQPLPLVIAVTLGMIVLSWLIWRFFERAAQSWTKSALTKLLNGPLALLSGNGTRRKEGIAN